MLALLLLTLPPVMGVHLLEQEMGIPFQVAVLYLCPGGRSLVEHARAVTQPLACSDLDGARAKVAKMVSRKTGGMKMPAIIAATIESVLENGTDAVFGTLFWFLIAGAPGPDE